jgi:hypothetical protein
MNIVCALMLSCTPPFWALPEDSAEMLRPRLIICNLFVIEDPYPAVIQDSTQYCRPTANWTRDCQTQNPHEERR